jgi:NifU-like protein involved in Fe-S cluster formation
MFDQINDQDYEFGDAAVEHLVAMLQRSVEADEDILGDGIALAGVAQYPARVKCALLAWMAWKDAAIQAGLDKSNGVTGDYESNKEQN